MNSYDYIINTAEKLDQQPDTYFDELVEKCKHGDENAFYELYNRHSKPVYNTIFRLVGHTAVAEDILQDCFVAAFQQIKDFQYTSYFGAWLKRIAINKSINYLRRRNLIDYNDEIIGEGFDEEGINEDDFAFKVEVVKQAISNLPKGYQTVVNLYLIEGISQEEISRILRIKHSTVRSQYFKAKLAILKELQKTNGYDR